MTGTGSGPWREVSGSHVFRSKLRAPSTRPPLRRAALIDQLELCASMPLTLVVAPAGTGKTSLVATWAASSTSPTAWLSLDESDHDATHFWTGVLAALAALIHWRAAACSHAPATPGVRRRGCRQVAGRS